MAVPARIYDLSAAAASNSPAGSESIGTNLDDYLRAGFAIVRGDLATKGADIASATTTDLGAVQGLMHDITGTTTITGFGTVAAGIVKIIKFEGALTLTHNSTSLILPGAANITTADGDVAIVISEGSGNWRCLAYAGASAYHASVRAGNAGVGAAVSSTALLVLGAAQTGAASLRITVAGGTPSAPVSGDIWTDGTSIFWRNAAGTTKELAFV